MDDVVTRTIGGAILAGIVGVVTWILRLGGRISVLETKDALTCQKMESMKEDLKDVKDGVNKIYEHITGVKK